MRMMFSIITHHIYITFIKNEKFSYYLVLYRRRVVRERSRGHIGNSYTYFIYETIIIYILYIFIYIFYNLLGREHREEVKRSKVNFSKFQRFIFPNVKDHGGSQKRHQLYYWLHISRTTIFASCSILGKMHYFWAQNFAWTNNL